MIIILIFTASPDHMAISLRVCSHLHDEYTITIVVVIPATIGQRTPVSLPIQDPLIDLQHPTKPININGIIGQLITHLMGLQTLMRPLSQLMPLGTLTILYLIMGPLMLSKSIPLSIAKIYVSWTQVPIALSSQRLLA